MSQPWWTPDTTIESVCCGAISCTEVVDKFGRCSKCKEHSLFVPKGSNCSRQPCDANCTDCDKFRC